MNVNRVGGTSFGDTCITVKGFGDKGHTAVENIQKQAEQLFPRRDRGKVSIGDSLWSSITNNPILANSYSLIIFTNNTTPGEDMLLYSALKNETEKEPNIKIEMEQAREYRELSLADAARKLLGK